VSGSSGYSISFALGLWPLFSIGSARVGSPGSPDVPAASSAVSVPKTGVTSSSSPAADWANCKLADEKCFGKEISESVGLAMAIVIPQANNGAVPITNFFIITSPYGFTFVEKEQIANLCLVMAYPMYCSNSHARQVKNRIEPFVLLRALKTVIAFLMKLNKVFYIFGLLMCLL
jgi:hypothetical protein